MIKKFNIFFLLIFVSLVYGPRLVSVTQNAFRYKKVPHQEGFNTGIFVLPDNQNAYFLDQSNPKVKDKLYLLNLATKKLTPLLDTYDGEFYEYDPLYDINFIDDVILTYKPKNSKYFGIWKFDLKTNKAICLTQGINYDTYLLGDDRENNLVFYFNDTDEKMYSDFYIMDRSGSSNKHVASNFLFSGPDWNKIDKNTYYFSGNDEKGEGQLLFYNIETKKTFFVTSSNYPTIGIYNNQLLVCHRGLQDKYYEFRSIDSSGKIKKLSIPEIYNIGSIELDASRNILLYTNEFPDGKFQVEILHLDTLKKEILFHLPNNKYPSPLIYDKKKNQIAFISECIIPNSPTRSKLEYNVININTKKSDSFEIDKLTKDYFYSWDCKYLFCYRINVTDHLSSVESDEFKNAIIDTTTKKMFPLSEDLKIDFSSITYVETTEQYLFTGVNQKSEKILGSVDKTGKVEIITKF